MTRRLGIGWVWLALLAAFWAAGSAQAQGIPLDIDVQGSGVVSIQPTGQLCTQPCTAVLPQGTPVKLSAAAPAGSTPGNFSQGTSSALNCVTSTCSFVLQDISRVTVTFNPSAGPFPVATVTRAGNGSGTVLIDQHVCGPVCAVAYVPGSLVTLQAQPDPGSRAAGFAGGCVSAGAVCSFVLTEDTPVTATFQPSPRPPVAFPNPDPIPVPDVGPSPTYPSVISVGSAVTSGLPAVPADRIRKLTVTLSNIVHGYPADLDILLVGPTGQAVLLMSDAGASFPLNGVTLTFDDAAPTTLPTAAPIQSGTFKPSNLGTSGDTPFPAPAPPGPYASQLSVFIGTDPTGDWKLFVRDDLGTDLGSLVSGWTLTIATGPALPAGFDFDGDGKADASVYRIGNGMWSVARSFEGSPMGVAFGTAGDIPAPGDYDGDGITDFAVFRPSTGQFFGVSSATGQSGSFSFGSSLPDDVPVPQDYDGDGLTDVALYRAATGAFFIRRSGDGAVVQACCAAPGDQPVPADYDGDGRADLAVYRPSAGLFGILRSSDAMIQSFCCADPGAADQPVVGDYDGDGRADVAVYRGATGEFLIRRSSDGALSRLCCAPPGPTIVPVVADYDGDGLADVAVYLLGSGAYVIFQSSTLTLRVAAVGNPALGDLPTVNVLGALRAITPPPPPVNPPPPPEPNPTPPDEPPPPPPSCKPDPEGYLPC